MYCLQWLLPVLLLPKPLQPALLHTHAVFVALYLVGFFLEKRPCIVCTLVFAASMLVLCSSGPGGCLIWGVGCEEDEFV